MQKRVLVVAYYFSPLGMGGVRRIVNFCQHLPKVGWTPVVLTVKPIKYFAYDQDFMKEFKCEVHRSESIDPLRIMQILGVGKEFGKIRSRSQGLSKFLSIPDNKIGWFPFAIRKGLQSIKNVDIIFSTAPPYTGLLIGWILKKISGVPLVVEFRDPWPYFPYTTSLHKRLNEWLKRKVLNSSDAIISINNPIKTNLQSVINKQQSVVVIPTGYNEDDFKMEVKPSNRFTIVYTGSFIPPRTPKYLLKALSELISEGKVNSDDIRIKLIGFSTEVTHELFLQDSRLEKIVKIESYRPHRYCVKQLKRANLLWVMIDETEKGVSTGKIGEYLGARKPILATVPEGPCADIIRKTQSGIVVPPSNIEAIKEALYDFYSRFKKGKLESLPEEKIKKYNWIMLTNKLSLIFDNLVSVKKQKKS